MQLHLFEVIFLIGPPYALDWSKETATVVSSGSDSSRLPELAIDGRISSNKALCSAITGAGKAWLRVDAQTVRYIREVRILFPNGDGLGTVILVGRSLQNNGSLGNEECGTISNDATASHWKNITCSQPVLGQIIYIEGTTNSMEVCEIQVFYGNVMPSYYSSRVPFINFLLLLLKVIF